MVDCIRAVEQSGLEFFKVSRRREQFGRFYVFVVHSVFSVFKTVLTPLARTMNCHVKLVGIIDLILREESMFFIVHRDDTMSIIHLLYIVFPIMSMG